MNPNEGEYGPENSNTDTFQVVNFSVKYSNRIINGDTDAILCMNRQAVVVSDNFSLRNVLLSFYLSIVTIIINIIVIIIAIITIVFKLTIINN